MRNEAESQAVFAVSYVRNVRGRAMLPDSTVRLFDLLQLDRPSLSEAAGLPSIVSANGSPSNVSDAGSPSIIQRDSTHSYLMLKSLASR